MNILMSLILYNPLEAMVLILPLWFLNRKNINWKNKKKVVWTFIKDTYILSTIFLLIQLPINFILNSFLYLIYNIFFIILSTIMILYKYNIKRFKNKNFILNALIVLIYVIILNIVISNHNFYLIFDNIKNKFMYELFANLYIKFIQIIVLIISLGGYSKMKKYLISKSKKNMKEEIAPTIYGFGEPKLSEKLKSEVKSSK